MFKVGRGRYLSLKPSLGTGRYLSLKPSLGRMSVSIVRVVSDVVVVVVMALKIMVEGSWPAPTFVKVG